MIKLVMTVYSSYGGGVARDFQVEDDKLPGGYDRMVASAFAQAQKDPAFTNGSTLNIRSNWQRP